MPESNQAGASIFPQLPVLTAPAFFRVTPYETVPLLDALFPKKHLHSFKKNAPETNQ
ncbi:MAG: hypothetical protein WBC18_15585 [Ottowia sp.]